MMEEIEERTFPLGWKGRKGNTFPSHDVVEIS